MTVFTLVPARSAVHDIASDGEIGSAQRLRDSLLQLCSTHSTAACDYAITRSSGLAQACTGSAQLITGQECLNKRRFLRSGLDKRVHWPYTHPALRTGRRVDEILRQAREVEVGIVGAADGVQNVDASGLRMT